MYINTVMLYGNLTRDPELKALPSGAQVVSFSVATNRTYKGKDGEKHEDTEYHNVVAFGRTAEVIGQYVKKGDGIYVEGRLQTRSWDKDGTKHYRTEIVVNQFQFGTGNRAGKPEKSVAKQDEDPLAGEFKDEEINPEDIPFF